MTFHLGIMQANSSCGVVLSAHADKGGEFFSLRRSFCCSRERWHRELKMKSFSRERVSVCVPVRMGRRSNKIATRKASQGAKKMKRNQKIGKQIAKAVREGGPNPTTNIVLASLLQVAKEYGYPKELIEKRLKATDKDQEQFTESIYEAYGFGGVGLIMEVLTEKTNRAFQSVRDVVRKSGGKMADSGSVLFGFKRAGVIAVKADENVNSDDLLLAAVDAGAEDVIEPEDNEDLEEKFYKILMPVEDYGAVKKKLIEAGFAFDLDNSGLEFIPVAPVEPDDEAVDLNHSLVEKLLELEDVDAVYTTQK